MNRSYHYHRLSDMIVENLNLEKNKVIGVTGTSCVGKSTFSRLLKAQMEEAGYTVFIIRADNYLKNELRGTTSFWTYEDEYLKPEHFDWKILWQDIERLKKGEKVQKKCYVRGIGWKKHVEFEPSDILIVEGLFLDSVEASKEMQFDMVTALKASDEIIRKRRMERDDYYRANFTNYKRTREETLREIESTLKAGKAYQSVFDMWNYLELTIVADFRAKISRYNIKKGVL